MAIACLRLVTRPPLPPLPERRVPRFPGARRWPRFACCLTILAATELPSLPYRFSRPFEVKVRGQVARTNSERAFPSSSSDIARIVQRRLYSAESAASLANKREGEGPTVTLAGSDCVGIRAGE
jgi:hypothetical protein